MGTYRTLIGLTVAYVALLLLVALTPSGRQAAQDVTEDAAGATTPAPQTADCVVCGIGETCDPDTGRCELTTYTPLPCVETATFDEEAGFCLPTSQAPLGTPEPTEEADDDRRGREPREPREPRQLDLPGFGD